MAYFFSPEVAGAFVPAAGAAPDAGAGAAAGVAFGDIDFTFSINATRFSSLINPWNVGINGWKPFNTFACDVRIDSRRYASLTTADDPSWNSTVVPTMSFNEGP